MNADASRRPWRDTTVALLLALLLVLAWTFRDWATLSALRLPDTDDAARLQQIRDWLAGQRFADLAQHRLGLGGLEMHWSRLPDLFPAATIAALTPLAGARAAELVAVIAWPALLFAAALALTGSIARALGSSGPVATIIAALAYPATTLFFPGRIDHHGLQLVLVLLLARATLGAGTLAWGAAAGLATAAGLAIGLETAPLLAAGAGAVVLRWAAGHPGGHQRLAGYAVSLVAALLTASVALRTSGWEFAACDGWNAQLWRGAQVASLGPLALAAAGFALATTRARLLAAVLAGTAALAAALAASPGCLHPYGAVDPVLARLWLANVAEAQPLLAAPAWHAVGYAGLLLAGLGASLWMCRSRDAGWLTLVAFQFAALVTTLLQLRGAYAGAMLAAPALAALVAAARAKGVLPLAAAWIASAGFVYPLLGDRLAPPAAPAATATADCTAPAALAGVAALPPGRLLAPTDLSAFALAATPHAVLAGPYHRNTAANRAMYQAFLATPEAAEPVARRLGVRHVAICADSFAELGPPPASLAAALQAGRTPRWLTRLSQPGAALSLFALSPPPAAH